MQLKPINITWNERLESEVVRETLNERVWQGRGWGTAREGGAGSRELIRDGVNL